VVVSPSSTINPVVQLSSVSKTFGDVKGALLAFTMSFDDFVITSFVSGSGSSTLPIVVYGMVRRNIEPSIKAISTIILLVTTALIYLANRLAREK
jgi:spermidine/putrescine transport system permease protein